MGIIFLYSLFSSGVSPNVNPLTDTYTHAGTKSIIINRSQISIFKNLVFDETLENYK